MLTRDEVQGLLAIYRSLRSAGQGSLAHRSHAEALAGWFMTHLEDALPVLTAHVGLEPPPVLEQNMVTPAAPIEALGDLGKRPG